MSDIKIGSLAPEFSVIDQYGKIHNLSDYKGKKVVLFFYPKANTSGCTAEACNLSDNYQMFKAKNYEIIGVSADTESTQLKFSDKFNFPFPLLADVNKEIINAYGVWGPKTFMGKNYEGINRVTFIIDENGIIENIISKVKTKEHASQIL